MGNAESPKKKERTHTSVGVSFEDWALLKRISADAADLPLARVVRSLCYWFLTLPQEERGRYLKTGRYLVPRQGDQAKRPPGRRSKKP